MNFSLPVTLRVVTGLHGGDWRSLRLEQTMTPLRTDNQTRVLPCLCASCFRRQGRKSAGITKESSVGPTAFVVARCATLGRERNSRMCKSRFVTGVFFLPYRGGMTSCL